MSDLQRAQDVLEEQAVRAALLRREDPHADLTGAVEALLRAADQVVAERLRQEETDRCTPSNPLLLAS